MEQKYFLLQLLFSPLDGLRKKKSLFAGVRTSFIRYRGLWPSYGSLLLKTLMFGGDDGREHLLFNMHV